MKFGEGYNPQPKSTRLPPLPAGAYIGQIRQVKSEQKNGDDVITILLDVTEGEFAGYYMKQYNASKGGQYEARYKGSYRLTWPGDDNPWAKSIRSRFNGDIWAIEQSNPGYTFADGTGNADERTLKGKTVGFVVRDREWELNGETGMTTEIGCLCSVDDVKAGTAPKLRPRMIKRDAAPESSTVAGYETVHDEEFPF